MELQIDDDTVRTWLEKAALILTQPLITISLGTKQYKSTQVTLVYGQHGGQKLLCIGGVGIMSSDSQQPTSQVTMDHTVRCVAEDLSDAMSGYMSILVFDLYRRSWTTNIFWVSRKALVRDSTLERSGKTEAYFVQSELAKVFEDNISAFLNPGITPGAHVMHLSAPKAEVIIRYGSWAWDELAQRWYRVLTYSDGTSSSQWAPAE